MHTEGTAGREGPLCDPLTLPRSLRFGGQINCSQKAEMPQAELYRAGAHYRTVTYRSKEGTIWEGHQMEGTQTWTSQGVHGRKTEVP